jgi:single-strand DNA-binding protein
MITIQLHGRLTRDPQLRELEDGTKLAALRIAANDSRGRVVYLNCAEFGKSGEATARTLSTGSEVVFYGELRFREVDGDNGRREYYWPSAKRVRRPPQQRARRPTARPRTPMTFRSEPNGRATTSVSPRARVLAIVTVEDRVDEQLAAEPNGRYTAPAQPMADAWALVRVLLGTATPAGRGGVVLGPARSQEASG